MITIALASLERALPEGPAGAIVRGAAVRRTPGQQNAGHFVDA
ncbi:MAG: hypothetical protein U1F54_12690 [Burkholderiales bacterium]